MDLNAKFDRRSKELNLLVYSMMNASVTTDVQSERSFGVIYRRLKKMFDVSDEEYELYLKSILFCPGCGAHMNPNVTFSDVDGSMILSYRCMSCGFFNTRKIKKGCVDENNSDEGVDESENISSNG